MPARSPLSLIFRLSLMAVAVHATLPAYAGGTAAEEVPADGAAAAPQTVEIKGVRSSNTKTIATKRDSVAVVDSVAADEIGKLPDFNVGDVLKRVTGVATLSYQGEPRFVIVRGLNANYNTTLIDGFTMATADVGGRQVYMEVLPSNFVRRVDVTKSALPEADGGAVGGVVNLVGGGAFNYRANLLDFSAKAGQNFGPSASGGARPIGEAQGRWATRFGPDDSFGLMATASYWTRAINVPQIETGSTLNSYTDAGARSVFGGGNGYAVPSERRWYNYDNTRSRTGLTTRLDWHPENGMSAYASVYDFRQKEYSDRYGMLASVDASARVANQNAASGTISSASQTADVGRLRWDRALYGANGEFKLELQPLLVADLRASLSKSTVENPQTWERFIQPGLAFNYDWSGKYPVFAAVSPNAADLSRYALQYHRAEGTSYQATVKDVQTNLRYNMGEGGGGWGGSVGARALLTDSATAFSRTDYSGSPYTLASVAGGDALCAVACNIRIPVIAFALADAAFAKYGPTAKATVDLASQYGNSYAIREHVNAAYAQAQFRTDGWLLVGGLRLERTRFDSDGYLATNGAYAPVSTSSSYSNLLPSLSGVFDTGADSKLRAGLSQTIGRPRFEQIATHGGALNTTSAVPSLSTGNPDLKPRLSTNLDMGHEWYLDEGRGIVSLALFHKRIKDEIFNYGQMQSLIVNGAPTQVLVTQARNTAERTRLTGIEFGITKDFTFLPAPFNGLGASVNGSFSGAHYPVTLSDGSRVVLDALQQQPKQIWNVALYYEKGPVHAKLAWSHLGRLWDSRFANFTPAGFVFNRYQQPTDNIDIQLAYDINKRMTISLDVLNATSQGQQYNFGPVQQYVQSAWKLSPSVLAGLNVKL